MRRSGRRERLDDEGGFSLVELLVSMALFSIVSVVALGGLNSLTEASSGTNERALAIADMRTALEQVVRDLRAANPIDAVNPVTAYDTSISFSVYCATSGADGCVNKYRQLTYQVTANALTRTRAGTVATLVGPDGTTALPPAQRHGAVVNTSDQPVFTYFDRAGIKLTTTGPGSLPSSSFRDCARSVEVHLVVAAVPGDPVSTVELRTRVDLRNYNEVTECTP